MQMVRAFIIFLVCFNLQWSLQAKDYKASLFGIKSDGISLNTGSIQKAVNFISENGGGRLVFSVGRYLTGSIELKSGVTIHLDEGAVLVGVPSIYDYYREGEFRALLYGRNQQNISVTGEGVIMGNGRELIKSTDRQIANGHISNDTLAEIPGLIHFLDCDSVRISGIILMNSGGDVLSLDNSNHVNMENITIKNGDFPGSGIVLSGNNHLTLLDSYIETGGEELTFCGMNQYIRIERSNNEDGKRLKVP